MPKTVKVQPGECLASIASKNGHPVDAIWNYADNAELKKQRGNPNLLVPGDVIVIPDKKAKDVAGATEAKHTFEKKAATAKLRLQMALNGEPFANLAYLLTIDGKSFDGKTDDKGKISASIPANAKSATLYFSENSETYTLNLGALQPVKEIAGVQSRLLNLGFFCDGIDGKASDALSAALKKFQKANKLTVNGSADETTKNKLTELCGV